MSQPKYFPRDRMDWSDERLVSLVRTGRLRLLTPAELDGVSAELLFDPDKKEDPPPVKLKGEIPRSEYDMGNRAQTEAVARGDLTLTDD